jgi:(p)ppGpp synthase/HD superfamily hydrolase
MNTLSRLDRAIKWAHEAHEGQTRKYTGAPYIVHPERVAWRLYQLGAPQDAINATQLSTAAGSYQQQQNAFRPPTTPKSVEYVPVYTNEDRIKGRFIDVIV